MTQAGRLFSSGRCDLDLICILMTETYFRSTGIRILEYLAFRILNWVYPRRAKIVSLGPAQIQARFWRTRPSLSSILCSLHAYDILDHYMVLHGARDQDLRKKIAIHVGEVRGYYFSMALYFRTIAQYWADHRQHLIAEKTAPDEPYVDAHLTYYVSN